ncbi:uncharacterized protein mRpS18B isoform X2 [Venturia canescens]|uniref:uncharacterized protein mRpS18B isoform X2 n=1 Tax=Venturia canescens TaxID=32260 RepID=UPI001C9CF2D4|nr:uncharacterized protein LOC122410411 isoform X2 [Venturia canescens]
MSLIHSLQAASATALSIVRANFANRAASVRYICKGTPLYNEENEDIVESGNQENEPYIDPAKDRRKPVPVETSIKYLASDAYKETYGNNLVWKLYRRNHKGMYPPKKTRKTCVRQGIISTGNPCPICRDEYLVFDHRNTALLKQFISEYNGAVAIRNLSETTQKSFDRYLPGERFRHDNIRRTVQRI